jgi:NADH-quinone oxidoreductase subunit L
VYVRKAVPAATVEQPLLARGWRYDETVSGFMGGPGRKGFELLSWFDRTFVDGTVNGVGTGIRFLSERARLVQTGLVRNYLVGLGFGAVVLVGYFLVRMV